MMSRRRVKITSAIIGSRQREAQHDLAQHQRLRRVDAEPDTTKAGTIVTSRRSQIGIVRRTNPCMMT